MALQFILGRGGSGKTWYCINQIKQELKENPQGPPMILLVPEQATHQYELALAKDKDLGGLFRLQVLSFERLTWRLLQEVGGSAKIHLSDLGKKMVLRKILEEAKSELKLVTKASEQPGFIDELVDTLAELKRYCTAPHEILDKLADDASGLLQIKLEDLAYLYDALENYLAQGYLDPEDHLTLLAERIEESKMLPKARLWLDGYTGFTPQEYFVLEKLLVTVEDIKITFCLDRQGATADIDESHPFYPMRYAMDKITDLARDLQVEIKEPIILEEEAYRFQTKSLKHLERHFFSVPIKSFQLEPEGLKLVSAVNRRAEVEAVARDIIALCREKAFRFRDIGVLIRDLEPYQQLITTIFSDYDLPFFIDQKRTVMHHPLIELLRSALEVITTNFNYEPIFRYLKTDLAGLSRESVDLLENYVLAYGLRGSKWTSDKAWTYPPLSPSQGEEELERINLLRERAAKPLIQLKKRLKKAKKVREYTKALYQLLEELQVGKELGSWKAEAEQQGFLDVAREHAQVWNETLNLFDQLVEALGDEELAVEEYRKVLESGFESMQLSLIPPGLDQVVISVLGHSRCPEIKAAYLLGVNDGVFPARSKEQGLFSETERELFNRKGIELAPSGRRRLFEEQYLIYTALTRASRYLWLSYALADEEGRALMPSNIVTRFKALFPSLELGMASLEPPENKDAINFICHPDQTLAYLTVALRDAKIGEEIHPVWWEVYNYYIEKKDSKKEKILRGVFHRNTEGFISSKVAGQLFGTSLRTSVSRLEKFAACPFAHFSAYGLKLQERALYRLEAPDLGQFFHGTLKSFVNYIEKNELDWSSLTGEECREITGKIVDDLLPQLQNEILLSTNRYRYLSRKLKRTLERSALVLTEHAKRGKFRPVGLELGFGKGEKLPPLIFELDDGVTIELTGRIDRVDLVNEGEYSYFRVIDYKSNFQNLSLEEIYYGLKLQLLTYLEVILTNGDLLGEGQALPAGLLYFPVKDPLISSTTPLAPENVEGKILKKLKMSGFILEDPQVAKLMDQTISNSSQLIPAALKKDGTFTAWSSVLSLEQFNLLRKHLQETLRLLGKAILAGNVQIAPYRLGNETACRFCKFKSVCQFDLLLDDNVYRLIGKNKTEEIWLKIRRGESREPRNLD